MHHIRDCLPELKSQINGMMNDVLRELEALGKQEPLSRLDVTHIQ